MRILQLHVLILANFALVACKRESVSKELLPGRYVCNLPGPQQTLNLQQDGTLLQKIDGIEYHGRWTTNAPEERGKPSGDVQVELKPYHFHWPEHLMKPGEVGFWVANARLLSDRVILIVSEEDALYCWRLL
jgi:hypothetical protein